MGEAHQKWGKLKAVHLAPEKPLLVKARGLALAQLGNYEEAIEAYDEVLQLDPADADIFTLKGQALLALYPFIPPRKKAEK